MQCFSLLRIYFSLPMRKRLEKPDLITNKQTVSEVTDLLNRDSLRFKTTF